MTLPIEAIPLAGLAIDAREGDVLDLPSIRGGVHRAATLVDEDVAANRFDHFDLGVEAGLGTMPLSAANVNDLYGRSS